MNKEEIKNNLLGELEGIEIDLKALQDYNEKNPLTMESFRKFTETKKAQIGSLKLKEEQYCIKFRLICDILENYFEHDLTKLTENQKVIYNIPLKGDFVVLNNGNIEFNNKIPNLMEFVSKLT